MAHPCQAASLHLMLLNIIICIPYLSMYATCSAQLFTFCLTQQPLEGLGLPIIGASRSHSVDPFWTSISPTQRTLPDITQHSQETDIHAPVGFEPLNPSKQAAADARRRPRSY
jgi:hypothetical protein